MKHNAIDQTELVNNHILFRSDYMIESAVIDESETDTKRDPSSYQWFIVDVLDGTEEHTLSCAGSTWVGLYVETPQHH